MARLATLRDIRSSYAVVVGLRFAGGVESRGRNDGKKYIGSLARVKRLESGTRACLSPCTKRTAQQIRVWYLQNAYAILARSQAFDPFIAFCLEPSMWNDSATSSRFLTNCVAQLAICSAIKRRSSPPGTHGTLADFRPCMHTSTGSAKAE